MSLHKGMFIVLLMIFFWTNGCTKREIITAPENIAEKKLTNIISGPDAVKVIDKMHGLAVATEKNIVAEYGEDPKDLLYISWYKEEDQAKDAFKLMISKMMEADEGPFTHIRALPDYGERVYMSIGMGAIHYIYSSSHFILWLQTYQDIGRELPDELLTLYPL